MTNRSLKSLEFDNAEDDLRHLGLSYVDEKALLVEGATDVSILSLLLEDQNIKIQELSECHAIIKTYEGLQRIASYVQDKRIVFIIDRDTRDDTDIERIKNENPDYFNKYFIVLQKQEIENRVWFTMETREQEVITAPSTLRGCLRHGIAMPATVVNHIVPHRGDQKFFWDRSN